MASVQFTRQRALERAVRTNGRCQAKARAAAGALDPNIHRPRGSAESASRLRSMRWSNGYYCWLLASASLLLRVQEPGPTIVVHPGAPNMQLECNVLKNTKSGL
jgi:hypothetical protein